MFFFCACSLSAQQPGSMFRAWKLLSYTGEVRLRGTYRDFTTNRDNAGLSSQQDYYFNGLLHLNTKSFILHPNFMLLDVSGTFNPVTRKDKYIGIPDYNENYFSQGFEVTSLLLPKKRLNFTGTAVVNTSIQNIENINRIQTDNRQLGVSMNFRSRVFPLAVGYSRQRVHQEIIGSDNPFTFNQDMFQASTGLSLTKHDNHYLSYLHTHNTGSNNISLFNAQPFGTVNNVDQIELNDEITFDSLGNYAFTSSVQNTNERSTLHYRRLYARENLVLKFPKKITFNTNYNLGIMQLDSNHVNYQGIEFSLAHQLFESLFSKLIYDINKSEQSAYDDDRYRYGCDLRYTKKIPTGKLTLTYSYFREYQNVTTQPTLRTVAREEHALIDGQIVLLTNANIQASTITVRDVSGVLIYQLNIDYVLIQSGPYVEIARVPGGLISNGASVYVDYTCELPGDFSFFTNTQNYGVDLQLFGNKLNLYYRGGKQDYDISRSSNNLALNYFNRYNIGFKVDLYIIKWGIEYEDYSSSILPHQTMMYFLSFQQTFKRFSFNVDANLQAMKMTAEQSNRQDADVSCKVAYNLFKKTRLDLDYMYRKIEGRGVDLELTTGKFEITSELHRLYISAGTEFFINKEGESSLKFKGLYIQLTRNF